MHKRWNKTLPWEHHAKFKLLLSLFLANKVLNMNWLNTTVLEALEFYFTNIGFQKHIP